MLQLQHLTDTIPVDSVQEALTALRVADELEDDARSQLTAFLAGDVDGLSFLEQLSDSAELRIRYLAQLVGLDQNLARQVLLARNGD